MSVTGIVIVAFLILGTLALAWWSVRARRRPHDFPFRPIAAYQALEGLLGRAAESGRMAHLSLGTAGIGDEQTLMAVVSLSVLRYLAEQGAAFRFSPITTTANAALLLAAQDVLYRARERVGIAPGFRPTDVQFIAPEPAAYAIGAQDIISRESVATNVMIGYFGPEYLLMGEPGARRDIVQIAGSNAVSPQAFILATANRALLGEEAFVASAYLTRRSEQIASLRLQDALRVAVVAAIVIGVIVKSVLGV
jgi:hypothetical protein